MAKVLVVDDDAHLRQFIMRALREDGHEPLGAENGLVGVQMACAHHPDLVLCDVMMDKLDGFGTLQALRRNASTTAIPFILMTGRPDTAGMRHGMEIGADDYLPKPFTLQQLRNAVAARLKVRALYREESDRRLKELRAQISWALPHELRTPLTGILGCSDMIINELATLQPEEIQAMARSIHDSARRLQRAIENTLLYSQLELAALDGERTSALRDALTPDALPVITHAAQERAQAAGRTEDLELGLCPAAVAVSPEHLDKLTFELADNAFKFSRRGTRVRVLSRANAGALELTLEDHGRGIKSEHLAKLDAYVQIERHHYEQQGFGLGLAICRRLAGLYGGGVRVQSQPGVGTTVSVHLPLAALSEQPAATVPPPGLRSAA